MRIALISTPFVSVPPPSYGGTELIVGHLARELCSRGHEVILYATGDSSLRGVQVRALYPEAIWPPDPCTELDHAAFAARDLARGPRVDVIHSHVAPMLAMAPFLDAPMVYTLHHVREDKLQPYYARAAESVRFVAISARQRELFLPEIDAKVVHHGLDVSAYPPGRGDGGYAAFLGRFAIEKGPATALDVAQRAGVPIRLGGRPHWKDLPYHEAEVVRRLVRPGVSWLGELGHGPKCALLGGACATLFPIDWEEPFGLVMIESMLCGTPVLAFPRGSTGEIIDEGVTGFICRDADEMADRLGALYRGELDFDRDACRARAAARFSVARMTDHYLDVYGASLERPALASVPAEA